MPGDIPDDSKPKRLVLCFDGTTNEFSNTSADTNIVKLYRMCDRSSKDQYHYYQPGIGTYVNTDDNVNTGFFGNIWRKISMMLDTGFGKTFDRHVLAGYRFLMRYYSEGDYIYIFGFSRGAFTARFLASMIGHIGLLSRGNEEMVPFAFKSYQNYERGVGGDQSSKDFISEFKRTFGRADCHVHFLGLFDTVCSVATFDTPFSKGTHLPKYDNFAKHVRHAVSVDERRVKFRPALLEQASYKDGIVKDHVEMWFPGNHGDVGGGWTLEPGQAPGTQLSDLALEWMLRELLAVNKKAEEHYKPMAEVALGQEAYDFLEKMENGQRQKAIQATLHDSLHLKNGSPFGIWLFWNFVELVPILGRYDYEGGRWVRRFFPSNKGRRRYIPDNPSLHESVTTRMNIAALQYKPKNENFPAVPSSGDSQASEELRK